MCMTAGVACTASCIGGYRFPDGRMSISAVCHNGEWIIERSRMDKIPDCVPIRNV